MKRLLLHIFCAILIVGMGTDQIYGQANALFVSVETGSDTNPGTMGLPFKTIEKALDEMNGGDTCFIMEGTYREEVKGSFLRPGSGSPLVFMALPGDSVTIDGTVDINAEWEVYQGSIYRAVIDTTIWQLFFGDEMLTSARWPNIDVFSEETWTRKGWSKMHSTSTLGSMVDDGSWPPNVSLAGENASFDGAIALLNLNYWVTGISKVENHVAGTIRFDYDPAGAMQNDAMFQVYDHLYGSYYYLEGSLACLDAPGEWYFNPETRELYIYMPDGSNPAGKPIRGKTQAYAFNFVSSQYIQLRDLHFFGTTFRFKNCTNVTIENCSFMYPSYSRRMLGSTAGIEVSILLNAGKTSPTKHMVRNCTFEYTDGAGLEIWGKDNVIENCLFHDIDFSCHGSWSVGAISSYNTNGLSLSRNTIYASGNSETISCGEKGLFEFNEMYNCGMLQGDGTIFQFTPFHFDGAVVQHNWVHDTEKRGIRLDDGGKTSPVVGTNAQFNHNVAWECEYQGLQGKGDQNRFFNNLAFSNHAVDLNLTSEERFDNGKSITVNNITGNVSRNQSVPDNILLGEASHNWIAAREGAPVSSQLRDIANRDFRLRPESPGVDGGTVNVGVQIVDFHGSAPDIGPYEFGDTLYHIPGRRLARASHPIPASAGTSHYEFVDLIWREGYRSVSSDIYFGNVRSQVENADPNSAEYAGSQVSNIYAPGELSAGETYYWRIDAVKETGVEKGEVWSFKAGVQANPEVYELSIQVYGSKEGVVSLLDHCEVKLGNRQVQTSDYGSATMAMVKEGRYGYSLERKGYLGISDSLHILSDTIRTDTLDYTSYQVSIQLEDEATGEVISGGEILFSGQTLVSDQAGKVYLSGVDYNWYELSASAAEYAPLESRIVEIWSDTLLVLGLNRLSVKANLKVLDGKSEAPLNRARINYNGLVKLTNSSGEVSIENLLKGPWPFSVEHDDYFTRTDTILMVNDTSLVIRMDARLVGVQFVLSDINGPVPGALVNWNDFLTQTSDGAGAVKFIRQLARESYGYSIEKEGYETINDTLFLVSDTLLSHTLNQISGTPVLGSSGISIFPNPTRKKIHITGGSSMNQVCLYNAGGIIVKQLGVSSLPLSLDLEPYAPGIYLLLLKTDQGNHLSRIIKQ